MRRRRPFSREGERFIRYRRLFAALAWIALASGCAHTPPNEIIRKAAHAYLSATPEDMRIISASALLRSLESGEAEGLAVVDIRSEAEFEAGHIPGALTIPFKGAAEREALGRLPQGKRLVIVCKSGHTASMLNAIYTMLGYEAVTLKDGMKGWQEAHGPVAAGSRTE